MSMELSMLLFTIVTQMNHSKMYFTKKIIPFILQSIFPTVPLLTVTLPVHNSPFQYNCGLGTTEMFLMTCTTWGQECSQKCENKLIKMK